MVERVAEKVSKKGNKPFDWRVLVVVRRILEHDFWKSPQVLFRGRCSGLAHDGNNPFQGSNVTLVNDQDAVILLQDRKTGEQTFAEYRRVDRTDLGDDIRAALGRVDIDGVVSRMELDGKGKLLVTKEEIDRFIEESRYQRNNESN